MDQNVHLDEFGRPWIESRAVDGSIFYFDPATGFIRRDRPINNHIHNYYVCNGITNQEHPSTQAEIEPQESSGEPTDKPIDAQQIHGTNWYIVQTGDEKMFYYNSSTKVSKWEKPCELKSNVLVDIMIQSINHKLAEKKKLDEAKINQLFIKKPKIDESFQNKHQIYTPLEKDSQLDWASKVSLEERVDIFKSLLQDIQVSAFTTWDNELPKMIGDPRFNTLSMKERRSVFNEYLKERVVIESQEKIIQQKALRDEYKGFLEEVVTDHRLSFSVFRMKFADNERFNVNLKLKEKETMFDEYIKELKICVSQNRLTQAEIEFLNLLKDLKDISSTTEWYDVKELIKDNEFYSKVTSNRRRELFEMHKRKLLDNNNPEQPKIIDRENREKASIEERRKKVDEERKVLILNAEKERLNQDRESAINNFNSLLMDLIKECKIPWDEGKKIIKSDRRYKLSKLLSKKDKKQLYIDHCDQLLRRKRRLFHQFLNDLNLNLTDNWEDITIKLENDNKFSRFNDSSLDLRKETQHFIDSKIYEAKADLRELLKETKMINHKIAEKININPTTYDEIIDILRKDKRYLVLEFLGNERDSIIRKYLDELARKGSPPPPTACINPRSAR